ncbi:MAG: peroxidase, partial [Bacteroidota bacterium]
MENTTSTTSHMELDDIQGLLVRGHGKMLGAAYLMLNIADADKARGWLRHHLDHVTSAAEKPAQRRLHLAFTWLGLQALGIESTGCEGFRPEFIQGMATEYRARILGDLAESGMENWTWGGPNNEPLHLVLMVYTPDAETLEAELTALGKGFAAGGLVEVGRLDSELNALAREHFGFRDGVSQPILPGLKKKGPKENTVPVGEFILGYLNAYDELPDSPLVPKTADAE